MTLSIIEVKVMAASKTKVPARLLLKSSKPILHKMLITVPFQLQICLSCYSLILSTHVEAQQTLSDIQMPIVFNCVDKLKLNWANNLLHILADHSVRVDKIAPCEIYSTIQCFNMSAEDGFFIIPLCSYNSNDYKRGDQLLLPKKIVKLNPPEVEMSNFHKRPLRVTGVMSKDYAYDTAIVQQADESFVLEDSFSVELLNCLVFTMNFTTILIVTSFWGHLLPNNSWTGMIALLLEDKADIGISSIADRPFRRKVVDFNLPTNEIRLSAFFQKPNTADSSTTALLKPLTPTFWIALFFLMVGMIWTAIIIGKVLEKISRVPNSKLECKRADLSGLGTWFIESFSYHQTEVTEVTPPADNYPVITTPELPETEPVILWSTLDCCHWCLSIFSLKGFYILASEAPYRIVMIVGSVTGFVIYSAYSGTLISFLSVVTDPIQNLGQLLSTDFTFAIINEPLALKFFSESPDPRGVMLYQKSQNERMYSSMKDASGELIKGSFVFVSDHSGAYESLTKDFSTAEACRIREIEIENAEQKQGTLVQKNSPYKRIIDYQILRMIQYGLVKRWNSKYLQNKPSCEIRPEYEGVQIESVLLAFELLVGGFLFGIFNVLAENKFYNRRKAKAITNTTTTTSSKLCILE